MSVREGYDKSGNETWPANESTAVEQEPEELVSPDLLLRYLDVSARVGDAGHTDYADGADSAEESDETDEDLVPPRILSMPEGITVQERLVGRAVAQWVLQVRCDCGRRWFELEIVDTATCPRCGVLVYVDLDARDKRPAR
jgi:hypothetical protein